MKQIQRMPIVVLLLAVTLAGCSGGGTPPPPVIPPTATVAPPPLPADASVPARILARGYLVVGMRYDLPPFGFITDEGTVAGLDVDLGHELARRWLGDPQAVRFRQVRSDSAADHLLAGDVDLVPTALLQTQPLEERVDFGPPLFEDGQALLVRASDATTIVGPASLDGLPVGIVEWSDAAYALDATVPFTPTFAEYATFDQAVDGLLNGEVSAVADLRRRLVEGLRRSPDLVIVGQYSRAFLAPAYAPNQPDLADLVALTVQDLYADGTLSELYARWLPGVAPLSIETWPGVATTNLSEARAVFQAPDTLGAIRSRGRLRVAVVGDLSPFAYLNADGTAGGYEVQLVQLMAQRWLGDREAVDFLPVTRQDGLQVVASGGADMLIGAIPHTREAERQVDFSLTTYVGGVGWLVRNGEAPSDLAALNGQSVAVVEGTNTPDVLHSLETAAGVSLVIVPYPTLEDALAALQAGEVVAIAGERTDMLGLAYATPGVFVTDDRLTRVPIAIALPPGDSAWRDRVNLTLQAMNWDGQFRALYSAWFDDEPPDFPPWPDEPLQTLRIGP